MCDMLCDMRKKMYKYGLNHQMRSEASVWFIMLTAMDNLFIKGIPRRFVIMIPYFQYPNYNIIVGHLPITSHCLFSYRLCEVLRLLLPFVTFTVVLKILVSLGALFCVKLRRPTYKATFISLRSRLRSAVPGLMWNREIHTMFQAF